MDFEPRLTILHQAGMLSEEDCRKVQDVIRFFQKKYGLTLTEENASAMITHLCAALGRIHRGEPVEPLDEEVYEETSQEPTFPKALDTISAASLSYSSNSCGRSSSVIAYGSLGSATTGSTEICLKPRSAR